MNNKNKKNTDSTRGPGRPAYNVKWPTGKFTMADLMAKNEVSATTGKGKFCTKLTLVKALARDHALKGKSFIVKLDETREPSSESGMGRKTFVYLRRSKVVAKPMVSVNVGTKTEAKPRVRKVKPVADYEATKAALLTPVPALTVSPEPVPVETAPVLAEPVLADAPAS